jgi:CRISPR-associated protein Cas4
MIRTGTPKKLDPRTVSGILDHFKEPNEPGRSKFHGKDVGYCPRKAVLIQVVKSPPTGSWSTKSEFYTSIGNALHEASCNIWRKSGVLVAEELRLENDWLNIGGYVDAIVEIDGVETVIEIKTCKTPPMKPYLDHKYQIATYGLLTQHPEMRLLYIGRNVVNTSYSLDIAEFDVDASFQKRALKNITVAKTFFDLGLVPPVPSAIKRKSDCSFCPFKRFCWESKKLNFEPFELWDGRSLKAELKETRAKLREMIKAGEVYKK